uniref:RHS repeat domain-containing protein n=1 Tax=Marinimicrobium alkaliphilum TaxID=2202654 RepID=UPI001E3EEAC9
WRRQIGGVAIVKEERTTGGGLINSETHYVIRDHLGSTSLLTDHTGAVTQEFYYDPWGRPRKPVFGSGSYWPQPDQPFRVALKPDTTRGYTDHEHLDEVGLIHMNGRVYDPKLARFVQADPIVQDPRTTRSLNRYSYVWNNPLNATDPSGFVKEAEEEDEDEEYRASVMTNEDEEVDPDLEFSIESQEGTSDNSRGNGSRELDGNIVVRANPNTGKQTASCEGCRGNAMLLLPSGDIQDPGSGSRVDRYRAAYIQSRSRAAGRAFDRQLADERSTWFMPTDRQARLAAELNASQQHLQQVMIGLGLAMTGVVAGSSVTVNALVGVSSSAGMNYLSGSEQTAKSLVAGAILGGSVGTGVGIMARLGGGGLGARFIWARNGEAITMPAGYIISNY